MHYVKQSQIGVISFVYVLTVKEDTLKVGTWSFDRVFSNQFLNNVSYNTKSYPTLPYSTISYYSASSEFSEVKISLTYRTVLHRTVIFGEKKLYSPSSHLSASTLRLLHLHPKKVYLVVSEKKVPSLMIRKNDFLISNLLLVSWGKNKIRKWFFLLRVWLFFTRVKILEIWYLLKKVSEDKINCQRSVASYEIFTQEYIFSSL